MNKSNSTNGKLLLVSAIFGIISAFPITGFIHGFIVCDCNGITGLLERIMKGMVGAITATITLGEPFYNEGGVGGTNIRFYVFITFIVFTLLLFLFSKRNQNK